jgi:hypothetical protein
MSSSYLMLAVVGAVIAIVYALLKPGAPPPQIHATSQVSLGPARNPGRVLIDHCEELGRDGAGQLIGRALAQVEAEEIAAKFGKAFGKVAPPASPTPPSPPAPSTPAPAVPNP